MRAAIACAMAGALCLSAHTSAAALAPAVAARIDGAPLLSFSVDAMMQLERGRAPATPRRVLLDQLVENRLLADAARQRVGAAALSGGARVGFAREVAFDDQLVATLRTLYGARMEQALRQLPGGMEGLLRIGPRPDEDTLSAVFGKPGVLLLDATLSAAQLARARSVLLLRYTLPGELERTVTLADVYRRQNVQGRMALFAREVDFMLHQARLQVAAQYVLDWSRRSFGAEAVADLRRVLSDQADTQAFLRMHGIGEDAHGDSALLDQLAGKVSAAQVDDYYLRHRSQFKRIVRVRARHIRLRDEGAARSVAAALADGADFAALARQHSLAPDAAQGGALGWVRHEGAPGWLAQLLFVQPQGVVSAPVRTPGGPDLEAPWEIVLVEQREEGYQERGSESVRYVASRALAREMAFAQLQSLRQQLRSTARIEIMAAQSGAAS
ncbi:MAG: peptidylprolyl isomerase [Pseudomonadota bacterium]